MHSPLIPKGLALQPTRFAIQVMISSRSDAMVICKTSFTVAFWLTDEIRHCDNFTDGWKDALNNIGFSS